MRDLVSIILEVYDVKAHNIDIISHPEYKSEFGTNKQISTTNVTYMGINRYVDSKFHKKVYNTKNNHHLKSYNPSNNAHLVSAAEAPRSTARLRQPIGTVSVGSSSDCGGLLRNRCYMNARE